jgi:hypothetical protein
MADRDGRGLLLAGLGLMLVLVLWGCIEEGGLPGSGPAATVGPLWTRVVAAEATLEPLETLVDVLDDAVAEMWNGCCAPGTLTAAAPVRPAMVSTRPALPTLTPYPTATAEPYFCRRCIPDDPVYGCPGGYICAACEECYMLCVSEDDPGAGCAFCAGIVIP